MFTSVPGCIVFFDFSGILFFGPPHKRPDLRTTPSISRVIRVPTNQTLPPGYDSDQPARPANCKGTPHRDLVITP